MEDIFSEADSLRVSALTKAVKLSPYVHEVTIGPNSKYCPKEAEDFEPDLETPCFAQNGIDRIKKKPVSNEIIETKSGNFHYKKILYELEAKIRGEADRYFGEMVEAMASQRQEMFRKLNRRQEEEFEKIAQEKSRKENNLIREWSLGEQAEHEKLQEEDRRYAEQMKQLIDRHNELTRFSAQSEPELNQQPPTPEIIPEFIPEVNYIPDPIKHISPPSSPPREVQQKLPELVEPEIIQMHPEIKPRPPEPSESVVHHSPSQSVVPENIPEHKLKFCSESSYKIYAESKAFLNEHETRCKPIVKDTSLKKYRFDLQKAVNTPLNSVSSYSGSHMRDKFDKLSRLLKGERITVADVTVSAGDHPLGVTFCTNTLAKKTIRQGEVLVSSNPEAAFPLAAVIVALWAEFDELAQLTRACFYEACPYLIPMFPPQSAGQSDAEFYQSRGYKYDEYGVVEKQDSFLKRMSGIFRLYAAIWITRPSKVHGHPFGIANGWRWMAAFINLKPEPDISATFLYDFLTTCGSDFYKYYGQQFKKVLIILFLEYIKKLEKIDEGGPKTRLEVYLQNVQKTGSIPPPKGYIPSGSW